MNIKSDEINERLTQMASSISVAAAEELKLECGKVNRRNYIGPDKQVLRFGIIVPYYFDKNEQTGLRPVQPYFDSNGFIDETKMLDFISKQISDCIKMRCNNLDIKLENLVFQNSFVSLPPFYCVSFVPECKNGVSNSVPLRLMWGYCWSEGGFLRCDIYYSSLIESDIKKIERHNEEE